MRLILFTLLALLSFSTAATAKPTRWNLLLITADDMNADSAGWLANKSDSTPNLDAFASSAHRFVNGHVTIPICQPGREALLTGRVPHRNGGVGFNPIRRDVPTLVEQLRAAGYFTGVIAKAVHMAPADKFPWHSVGEQSLGKQPRQHADKFKEMLATARADNKPFFINANICDPHRPFINPLVKKKSTEPLDGVKPYQPHEIQVPPFLEDLPKIREELAQYYSNVNRFDQTFGLLLKELKAAGHDRDTMVVFLSDHGMSFPFAKASVYRNGTWSPFLIRYPGMGVAQVRQEMVSSVDLMPTIMELLGLEGPAGMDGRSLVPLLQGRQQPDRDIVVTHVNKVSSGKSFVQRCIRTKDRALMYHGWVGGPYPFQVEAMSGLSFKAMTAANDPAIKARVKQYVEGETWMFFDLGTDPDERNNVIADPKYKEEVNRLGQRLLAHMKQTDDPETMAFEAAWRQR